MTTKAQQQAIALANARRRQAQGPGQTTGTPLSLEGDLAPPQAPRTIGQTIRENIIGEGAVDTPGEMLGEAIQQGGRGIIGGTAALGDLVTAPFRSAAQRIRAGLEGGVEAMDVAPGAGIEALQGPLTLAAEPVTSVQPESTAGEFARTVGEFVPGAAAFGGPRALMQGALVAGAGSEAAGQLTEGTDLEPFARVAGAIAAPTAVNFGSKGFQTLFSKSAQTPTVENLKALKTEAYRAADRAEIVFPKQQTNRIITRAAKALDEADFVPEVDLQTKAAFDVLTKQASKPLTMGQLDKLRQGLWRRYNADKSQVAILDMIDAIDDTIQTSTQGGELMAAARLANSRFKKAELLDDAFTKAADQTASTGSGGNIVNKYKQAVTSIINNPKKAKWFSEQEITVMREFVRGGTRENLLRLGGKLSPSGNGLMAALNLGAVAVDPTMLAVTAGASGAKALSDRAAIQGAANLQRMIATGQAPTRAAPDAARIGGTISGLLAQ